MSNYVVFYGLMYQRGDIPIPLMRVSAVSWKGYCSLKELSSCQAMKRIHRSIKR